MAFRPPNPPQNNGWLPQEDFDFEVFGSDNDHLWIDFDPSAFERDQDLQAPYDQIPFQGDNDVGNRPSIALPPIQPPYTSNPSPPPFQEARFTFDDIFDLPQTPPSMPSRANAATTPSSVVDLTSSPPQASRTMAPDATRKRKREAPSQEGSKSERPRTVSAKAEDLKDVVSMDLTSIENDEDYKDFQAREDARKAKEQEDKIKAQNQAEAERPMKLVEFQCVICLDNPTDLTVTHCGHLFCAECLHNALYAGDKKVCPVCRAVIAHKPGGTGKNSKGYFPLEMKLMTTNKKGKRPLRAS